MKITLLASSMRGHPHHQFATSYAVGETIAVDAGSLGFVGTPEQQRRIRHLFITHSHIDHTATLPIFLENAFQPGGDCPILYASQPVLEALQEHMFNDVLWPDFIGLSKGANRFVEIRPLDPGESVDVDGFHVTAVPMDHVVPTQGYLFQKAGRTLAIGGDTGPTEHFWRILNQLPTVDAVILETAFPDRMAGLGRIAKHLTPADLRGEWAKLTAHQAAKLLIVHVKAFARHEILHELHALQMPNLEVMEPDRGYDI